MIHPLVAAVMEATYEGNNQPRPIKHGTLGGAKAHARRGEDPCGPCLREKNKYNNRALAIMRRQRRARSVAL